YRMTPNSSHHDAWHTDNTDGRLVAMSLNLSPQVYEGGVFQMRERESEQFLVEFANCGLGDAILFPISENLVHRVTEVQGNEPKTAFSGWFNATAPSFQARLENSKRSKGR